MYVQPVTAIVHDQLLYLTTTGQTVSCLDKNSPSTPTKLDRLGRPVLTTTEQLAKPTVLQALVKAQLSELFAALVMDEAHCVALQVESYQTGAGVQPCRVHAQLIN